MGFNARYGIHIILALLAVWFGSSSFAKDKSPHTPLAVIPIEIINNRVLVNLTVGPYNVNLTLDTGASSTALFQSQTDNYNDLEALGNASVIFPALDEIVKGVKLAPVPIKLGNYTFMPSRLLRVERRPPVGDRLNLKFDGVLGQDFFNKFAVEINRENRTLSLYTAGTNLSKYFRTKLSLYMKGTAPHIKLYNKMPWEEQKRTKELMLDTGYPGAMVIWGDRHFYRAAKGNDVKALRAKNTGIFTAANFRVGVLRFYHIPVFVAPKEPLQAHNRDGILGSNILIWFHHVIDFPRKQLLLDVGSVHFNRMDGVHYLPNNEDYIVKRFARKSPSGSIYILGEESP